VIRKDNPHIPVTEVNCSNGRSPACVYASEVQVAFPGFKEDRYSIPQYTAGNIKVDKKPFSRVASRRSARKANTNVCIIKPVTIKYMAVGNGIIFHQIIMLTIADPSAKKKNPGAGFCRRIKRRKKMGYTQVAKGIIHLPFENNMKIVPANRKRKDWRLDFIVLFFK